MVKIVDNITGNIKDVSQRTANALADATKAKQSVDALPTSKDQLKTQVKNAASSIPTDQITGAATKALESFGDANGNVSGQVAGLVQGGMTSLTQKTDAFKGELTDAKETVEGLLSGDMSSLENLGTDMVEKTIAGLLGKFGAKVEISYSEPDSDGVVTPLASSLSVDTTAADKIQGILTLITGLGIAPGNLQNIIAEASPEGLLNAGKNLASGKLGAFDADSLKSLATSAVTEVTGQLKASVGSALASVRNINKTILSTTNVDSDGALLGNLVFTKVGLSSTGPSDSDEFDAAMFGMDAVGTDLDQLVSTADNVKQNLVGAETDLKNLSGGKDGKKVLSATQTKDADRQTFTRKGEEYKGLVGTKVAGGSKTGIIQGISNKQLTNLRQQVKAFAPSMTDEQIEDVLALSQGDSGDVSAARKLLYDATGKPYAEIDRLLTNIDSTITSATASSTSSDVFGKPYTIGDYQNSWSDGKDNPIFPYISSVEEMQAEIRFISRKFGAVVVHWTETATNKNIGSEEINDWHLAAGIPGISYHYVIRRDGSLQRGRPVNLEGDNGAGQSLDIVFVGGINAPTGTPNQENFISARSLTRSQFNTFDHFCRAVFNTYPAMSFFGHSEIDTTQVDPGFSVRDYIEARFGK